jgi:hypothetical protein
MTRKCWHSLATIGGLLNGVSSLRAWCGSWYKCVGRAVSFRKTESQVVQRG